MRDTDTRHPRLEAYFDGQMTRKEAGAVEAHLATCALCRSAVADLRLLAEALGAPEPVLPPGFAERARERAVCRRLPAAPLWWIALPSLWRVGLVAMIVLAVFTGVRLGRNLAGDPTLEAELAAALDAPETTAMLAVPGTNGSGAGRRP